MAATLRTKPGTSTAKQRQLLHQVKRKHGWSDEDLHLAIGAESTTLLSAAEASRYIRRLGGGDLPNPPGRKPATYERKRKRTSAIRMITVDHEEQILRLLSEHFRYAETGDLWLKKNFDARTPRELLTAKRAGEVIHVLKEMIARKGST